MIAGSICFACRRWQGSKCEAFPGGIPERYFQGTDHRRSSEDGSEVKGSDGRPLLFALAQGMEHKLDAYEDFRVDRQELTLESKHLTGRHNQRDHGRRGDGVEDAIDAVVRAGREMIARHRTKLGRAEDPPIPDFNAAEELYPHRLDSFGVESPNRGRFKRVDVRSEEGVSVGSWWSDSRTGRRFYLKRGAMIEHEGRREFFASRLKAELGMLHARVTLGARDPVTRHGETTDTNWVAIEHVDDSPDLIAADLEMQGVGLDFVGNTREWSRFDVQSLVDALIFDFAVDESDRHNGNWIVMEGPDGTLHAVTIDHSLSLNGGANPHSPRLYYSRSGALNQILALREREDPGSTEAALRVTLQRFRGLNSEAAWRETFGDTERVTSDRQIAGTREAFEDRLYALRDVSQSSAAVALLVKALLRQD